VVSFFKRSILARSSVSSVAKRIVGDYGNTIVVRLESGKEISEYRDEVIIHD
jgi:hypothetical protein